MIDLDRAAFAIRPARIIRNELRIYSATTFPENPYAGCHQILRMCESFGYLKDDGADCVLDILDDEEYIIQDFPLTRNGFDFLRTKLKFRRVRIDD